MAGIIGAINNYYGVVGVAPQVELYAAKIDDDGNNPDKLDLATKISEAIYWGITNNMDIMSMSIGTGSSNYAIL